MSDVWLSNAPYPYKRAQYWVRQGVSIVALLLHVSLLANNGHWAWWVFALFHGCAYSVLLYRLPFLRQPHVYLDSAIFGVCIALWGFNPVLTAICISSINIVNMATGGTGLLLRCLGLLAAAALITGGLTGFHYQAQLPTSTLWIASLGLVLFMTIVGARIFSISNRLRQTRNNLAQYSAELQSINALAVAVNSNLDVSVIVDQVMRSLETKYPFEALYILNFDEKQQCLEVEGIYGSGITPSEHAAFQRFRFDIDRDRHSIFVNALLRREVAYIPRITAELVERGARIDRELYGIKPTVSLAYFPIYVKDVVVAGAGFMNYEKPFQLTEKDISIIQDYLVQVGTAVRNASLLREARAAREEAEEARRKAETSEEAKSRFLANMSHEIRTPMTVILGYTETLLEDQTGPEERARFLRHIDRSGRHLLTMINDILDLSKIEAKKIEVEKISCNLVEILCDMDAYLSIKCRSQGLGYELHIDYPFPSTVVSDPTRLKQILLNLCNNATKFTPKGRIILSARLLDQTLNISVQDTGIGIDPADQERIFSAFHQADSSTTRLYGGTGLGLCIAKNLAQLLGGDLSLDSRKPGGSTFTLSLPVSVEKAQLIRSKDAFQKHMEDVKSAKTYDSMPNLQGRVLVAEDNLDNQNLIRRLLEQTGLIVDIVSNGYAALEAAQQRRYGLLLLDIQMPQLSGLQVAERVKALGLAVPMVAFTANVMKDQLLEYQRAGFDDVLEKPIIRSKLYQTLKQYLLRPTPFGPRRVLIVEDNEINQMILHRYVTKAVESPLITLASNGQEAVQQVGQQDFDLILMDMEMPRMDGLTATRVIRELGYQTPIYVVSGNTDPDDIKRCIEAGATGHFAKPINKAEILPLITGILSE